MDKKFEEEVEEEIEVKEGLEVDVVEEVEEEADVEEEVKMEKLDIDRCGEEHWRRLGPRFGGPQKNFELNFRNDLF